MLKISKNLKFLHFRDAVGDALRIPLESIKLATNNFGDNNYISRGGFGKVYKGELIHSGIQVMVAVKRLDSTLGQGAPEFWKEIMMLSRYRHENLVSLLGFSDEGGENILVNEYLSNKSLDMNLSSTTLSWIQRLKICIGAARGLEYLHNPGSTTQRVLHRDIKSSNILLDENWKAKISDFGLSKFGPANQEFTFLISHASGTIGYCDPLYMDTGFLTKESDIYSFGVVLFEVLCGRLCFANYNDNCRFLSKFAQMCYEEKKIDTIVHSGLQEKISPDCLDKFSTIAYRCLQRDRNERPCIAEIIKQLEIALQDQVKHDVKKERKLKSHGELEEDVPLGDMYEEELKACDDLLRDMAIKGHGCGSGGMRGLFTASQWMELEHQALIYKYITANIPVPSDLLIPIKKSLETLAFSGNRIKYPSIHYEMDSGGLEVSYYNVGLQK